MYHIYSCSQVSERMVPGLSTDTKIHRPLEQGALPAAREEEADGRRSRSWGWGWSGGDSSVVLLI